MKRTGHADLPLHYGRVPAWLYERMERLGGAIAEAIVQDYDTSGFLERISDPFWFQSLGCVMGMDWHSSGITTSVLGSLKRAVNKRSHELGLYFCGGRGRHSRATPQELMQLADKTGLDGPALVRSSKLTAKVDNTAIQDGFQLYLHTFILSDKGEWAVVQQGMNGDSRTARRYHWHSPKVSSFVEEPHASVCGDNQGLILNLTDSSARDTRQGILELTSEKPMTILQEASRLQMPRHHDVRPENVDLKRLGSVLILAQELEKRDFESLLLLKGLGPRTIQSLTLVSEVIHGTPTRFRDPARFSFAHGGKDGHPFPVPTKVYDEVINTLQGALQKARIGQSDKKKAIQNLHRMAARTEEQFVPSGNLNQLIEEERRNAPLHGGRTVFDKTSKRLKNNQLSLFG